MCDTEEAEVEMSISQRRGGARRPGRGRRCAAVVLLVGLAAAALLVGPSFGTAAFSHARAGKTSAPAALLVVQRAGAKDDLVRVAAGTPQKVGTLPARAGSAVAAPDGSAVAYLPWKTGPVFWVATPAGAVATVSLADLGVRVVDAVTWTSPTTLIVSGSKKHGWLDPATDFLYEVTAGSWTVKPFRGLRGAEPSASPEAGTLVFVRIADVGPWPGMPGVRKLRERLMLLDLARSASPKAIETESHVSDLNIRGFYQPQISPDGEHVATSTTGSDTTAIYRIWSTRGGAALYRKRTNDPGYRFAPAAWDASGERLAFWGMTETTDWDETLRVWTYDVATGRPDGSGELGSFAVDGFAWSAGGDLAIGLYSLAKSPDQGTVSLATGGSLSQLTEVVSGGLPAWVE